MLKQKDKRRLVRQNVSDQVITSQKAAFYWLLLEQFSIKCRKTKTKVITVTKRNKGLQYHQPMRPHSENKPTARTERGKRE